ncbi:unnamed protein product [Gadus morhua 'NCC']
MPLQLELSGRPHRSSDGVDEDPSVTQTGGFWFSLAYGDLQARLNPELASVGPLRRSSLLRLVVQPLQSSEGESQRARVPVYRGAFCQSADPQRKVLSRAVRPRAGEQNRGQEDKRMTDGGQHRRQIRLAQLLW